MDRKNTGFKTVVKCRRGAVRSRPGQTLWMRNPVIAGGEILKDKNPCPSWGETPKPTPEEPSDREVTITGK